MKKAPRPEDVKPRAWYRLGQAAELIGISGKTLRQRAELGPLAGGIAYRVDPVSGRKEFHGQEILRYIHREPYKRYTQC